MDDRAEVDAATSLAPTPLAPTSLAPTSLDLLLARAQRGAPRLAQATDLVLIGLTVALVVVDGVVWAMDPVVESGRLPTSITVVVPLLGLLAVGCIAARTRRPALALVVLSGASVVSTVVTAALGASLPPSFAALFALAVLTAVVLRREPGGSAIALASLAGVAVAAEAIRPMVGAAAYLLVVCEGAFAIFAGAGVYLRWSDWRRVVAAEAVRSEERLEIARELHDLVGHYVTGIVVQAQAARHVSERRAGAADEVLLNIETAGSDALTAMRWMVGGLRQGSHPTPGGTWDEVDQMVTAARAQGEPVTAAIDLDVRRGAAPAVVPSVYRIVAEALTNVRRHAQDVTSIEVSVARVDDRLVVSIHDDGEPVAPQVNDTFGIIGMRERATALGGSLVAGPAPAGGWLVRADLPMESSR